MTAKLALSILISTIPACLVHGSDAGDYMDPDLFEDASVEVQSDGVQAGDLSLAGITEQVPVEDSLPPIRQVFPGLNVSYLVESAKRHSPKDFESRRAWYTPVMHVNGSSVVSGEFNSLLIQHSESMWKHFNDVIVPKVRVQAAKSGVPDPIRNIPSDFVEWQSQSRPEETAGEAERDETGLIVPKLTATKEGRAKKRLPTLFARTLQLYLAQVGLHTPDDVADEWADQIRPICERLPAGGLAQGLLEQRALAPTGLAITMLLTGGRQEGVGVGEGEGAAGESQTRVVISDPRGQLPPFGHTLRLRISEASLFVFPAFMTQQITGLQGSSDHPAWVCRGVVAETSISESISETEFAELITTVRTKRVGEGKGKGSAQ